MFNKILTIYFLVPIASVCGQSINPENITIIRDDYGIPHVYASKNEEIAYGLAWVQCEDEFENLQLGLLFARERLGRKYGREGAAGDFFSALFHLEDMVAEKRAEIPPHFLQYIDGYVQGLNDYASAHPKELLDKQVFPVTIDDMLEIYPLKLTQFMGAGEIVTRIVNGKFYDQSFSEIDFGQKGSNAFAFKSHMTKDGRTYLIANPHQPFTGPEHFYEVQLQSATGWQFQGALFPGSLSPQIGTNGHLAWTHTNNYFDHTDVYALEMHPEKKLQYAYDGEWKKLEERKIKLRVKLKWLPFPIGVKRTVYESIYGPTLKSKEGHFFAIRTPPAMGIKAGYQWYEMSRAKNLSEFRDALRIDGLPYFNIAYADKYDEIFYLCNGHFPVRTKGYDYLNLTQGNTSATRWTSFYPLDERPLIANPECGYVYNVNHNPFKCTCVEEWRDTRNFDPLMRFDSVIDETMRSYQWREIYEDGTKLSMEELKVLKYDARIPEKDSWMTLLDKLRMAEPREELNAVISRLKEWDAVIDPQDDLPTYLLLSWFKRPYQKITLNNFTPEYAADALVAARTHMIKYFGKADVPFQEFFRFKRGEKDLPVFGFPGTLAARSGAIDKANGRYYSSGGDGFMMFIQFEGGELKRMESIVPYGGSQIPESPYYNNQMELFTEMGAKEMTFDRDMVEKKATRIYHPVNEDR